GRLFRSDGSPDRRDCRTGRFYETPPPLDGCVRDHPGRDRREQLPGITVAGFDGVDPPDAVPWVYLADASWVYARETESTFGCALPCPGLTGITGRNYTLSCVRIVLLQPMTPKTRKRIIRLILFPILGILLLVGIAVGLLYSQQQRLVKLAVGELNKRLPGELTVGGSDISLFQNFPYISIGLNKVQFYPNKLPGARPLYEAERLYVGFSLPDILKQRYRVRAIALKNGYLNLVRQDDGQLNIVEASRMAPDTTATTRSSGGGLDLDIRKLVLKNMTVSYLDQQQGQRMVTHIERIQASLRDNDRQIDAGLDGKMLIDYAWSGDTTLFRNKRVETNIRFTYEKSDKLLRVPEGRIQLEEAVFTVAGTADLLHGNTLDLHFSGDKPDLRQLFAFAPQSVTKELEHFRYDGHLAFDGKIKGPIGGGKQPLIELSFACSNAWMHNTRAKKNLDSLAFKGYYTNGPGHCLQTSELRLLDMNARPGKGLFRGNFILRDFADPKLMMQVNSDLELGFIG